MINKPLKKNISATVLARSHLGFHLLTFPSGLKGDFCGKGEVYCRRGSAEDRRNFSVSQTEGQLRVNEPAHNETGWGVRCEEGWIF